MIVSGRKWDTRNLRAQAREVTKRRRAAEQMAHRSKGRPLGRLSPLAESAVAAMQRRLRGEGL